MRYCRGNPTVTAERGGVKLALPDLVSNSYFPALAAAELGLFAREGLDIEIELIFPPDVAYARLREGSVDFVAASAHTALAAFPEWQGAKILAALGQGMYWFLVMRSDIGARRGDIDALKGRSIGAAGWVDLGLRRLLAAAGIDPARDDVRIAPIPLRPRKGMNFGVLASRALASRAIDGFWANGVGAELAWRSGTGTLVLDVRRGDGPPGCFDYTFPALVTSDALIAREPDAAAAAVRAIVATQRALREDPQLAARVGQARFPREEAQLIQELIERDLPFYEAAVAPASVAAMNAFSRDVGILQGDPAYADVVATAFSAAWTQ